MRRLLSVFLVLILFISIACQRSIPSLSENQTPHSISETSSLLDNNPPKNLLDNFRSYSMAFVIFTNSDYPTAPDTMISVIRNVQQQFSKTFNRMTYGRITIDTSDDIFIVHLGNQDFNSGNSLADLSKDIDVMLQSFDKLNSYDYITIFHTWPAGDSVDFHKIVYDTNSKLRGINYIGSIALNSRLESDIIDQVTLALLHETSHEWGAYEGQELGILNDGTHYHANVVASDPLGGCPWFISDGKIDCTYYKANDREFLDTTLFVMGIIPESEVDPILIVNSDGTSTKVPIQNIVEASLRRSSLTGIAPTDLDGDGTLDWQENQGVSGRFTDHLRSDASSPLLFPDDGCLDTDEGLSLSVRGTTGSKGDTYQDICFVREPSTDTRSVINCDESNCYLKEYYCDSGHVISVDVSCSDNDLSSCTQGACIR